MLGGLCLVLVCLIATADGACDQLTKTDALIIIDMQNDFMEEHPLTNDPEYSVPEEVVVAKYGKEYIREGSLRVQKSSEVIPVIHDWISAIQAADGKVMMSLDWHPAGHCSFCRNGTIASNPEYFKPNGGFCSQVGVNNKEFDPIGRCMDDLAVKDFARGALTQWPDHCVRGTFGAQTSPFLRVPKDTLVFKKGAHQLDDSYSAFGGHLTKAQHPFWDTIDTGSELEDQPTLLDVIKDLGIKRLFVVGVATDFCVKNTALDAVKLGVSEVVVPLAGARGVLEQWVTEAKAEMIQAGVKVVGPEHAKPSSVLSQSCNGAPEQKEEEVDYTRTQNRFGGTLVALVIAILFWAALFLQR